LKVLLYFENSEQISKSGIGMALNHQKQALTSAGIEYTLDPNDDFDILHINTVFLNSEPIIAKARKKGAAIVYHAHSTEEDFRNSFIFSNSISKIFKERLKSLYQKGDSIITPTPYSKHLLLNYGITAPINVVSNGIDTNVFIKDENRAKAFRDHFNLTENDKVVISSGLWIKRKGILDFIKVAEMLPDVKFFWFGETPLMTIPADIRQAVTKEHPSNVFFPGYMTGDVYLGAFSAADLFFFPTYEETEGIVVLESMSCSGTALVRDIPVFDGWLADGVNCFKGKTNEDFARIIKDKIDGKLPDVSKNARAVAEDRSIERVGQKLKAIYEQTQEDVITRSIREYSRLSNGEKKLTIGLFSDTFPPDVNGVSVSVDTLRKQLKKMGHTVYVITASLDTVIVGGVEFSDGILRIPAVKIKQLYGYRLSRPVSLQALEYIKNMNLDVIHINTEFTIRLLAKTASSMYNIPLVYTCHTMYEDYTHYITKGYFEKESKKLVELYTKHLYDSECEIIVPSQKTFDILKGYGIKKQMHIIPTGIDTERLNPKNSNKEEIEQIIDKYGLRNKFRIVYVGRLAQEKSLDTIIQFMPKICTEFPDTVLVISGYGPSEDELKELVQNKELDDKVIFTGKQNPEKIQSYYAIGDVFATASTSETQGLTYIEAMAAGLPVIAKYDECLKSILISGKSGFYFDSENDFVNAVRTYRNLSDDEKNQMKKNAVDIASMFSTEAFGNNVIKAYFRAIKKNSIRLAAKNKIITD